MRNLSHSTPKISFRRRVALEEAILTRDSADWSSPPFLLDIYGAKHGSPSVADRRREIARRARGRIPQCIPSTNRAVWTERQRPLESTDVASG